MPLFDDARAAHSADDADAASHMQFPAATSPDGLAAMAIGAVTAPPTTKTSLMGPVPPPSPRLHISDPLGALHANERHSKSENAVAGPWENCWADSCTPSSHGAPPGSHPGKGLEQASPTGLGSRGGSAESFQGSCEIFEDAFEDASLMRDLANLLQDNEANF